MLTRCAKCRRRVWTIVTKVTRDDREPLLCEWLACELGCAAEPTDDDEDGVCWDEIAESRHRFEEQYLALERALWLGRFRDHSLRLYCSRGDLMHMRRARRIESKRVAWVHERVRPVVDLDELVLPLTSIEQIAWGKVGVSWMREAAVVGGPTNVGVRPHASFYRADRLVEAVASHSRSGLPVAVGPRTKS